MGGRKHRKLLWPVNLLLVLPYIAVLFVPFYDRAEPSAFGIPFFYWYQLLWIPLGVAVLAAVRLATRPRE